MTLFIKDALFQGETTSVLIENNTITGIGKNLPMPVSFKEATACANKCDAETVSSKCAETNVTDNSVIIIDARGKALFPTFANMHTHAAMTLFRGYGDDHPLQEWLQEWIWPAERNLDDDIVYWATRLACLEMIKSGTTLFNNMYFYTTSEIKAVADSGIRAMIGYTCFDFLNPDAAKKLKHDITEWYDNLPSAARQETICPVVAPHAPYTVSGESLIWLADFAVERGLHYHIHMSETENEVAESVKNYGLRPYARLDKLGVLDRCGDRLIGAHSLHLDSDEIRMLGQHRATVVHNPNSNLKLGSGCKFMYTELRDAGANVTLGTDGCSSSNNLDMLEATKTMALLQKGWRGDPTVLPAQEALQVATANGFRAAGLNAGVVEVGAKADLMLVDLDNIGFIPDNDTVSNLLYAAHSDAIDTVICNGRVVMQGRNVKDEAQIKAEARRVAKRLLNRQ